MMRMTLLAFAGLVLIVAGAAPAGVLSSKPTEPTGSQPSPEIDEYTLDDGTGENGIGLTAGGVMVWLNRFNVLPGAEVIVDVSVAWGTVPAGRPGEILIFSDPNNDGDPSDIGPGSLLHSQALTSGAGPTDVFTVHPVPGILAGNVGDSFFVGLCLNHASGQFPARLDQTSSQGRSWVGGEAANPGGASCANPNSMSIGSLFRIDDAGFPGNWMVRASGAGATPVTGATWTGVKTVYR